MAPLPSSLRPSVPSSLFSSSSNARFSASSSNSRSLMVPPSRVLSGLRSGPSTLPKVTCSTCASLRNPARGTRGGEEHLEMQLLAGVGDVDHPLRADAGWERQVLQPKAYRGKVGGRVEVCAVRFADDHPEHLAVGVLEEWLAVLVVEVDDEGALVLAQLGTRCRFVPPCRGDHRGVRRKALAQFLDYLR